MDRATALNKLRKRFGKNFGYRVDPNAPKQEDRDAARAALGPACKERDALVQRLEERRKAILQADAEYQQLLEQSRAARKAVDKLGSITRHHKITIGETVMGGLYFSVHAEGDSWEQIFEKLDAKKKVA